MRIMEGLLTCYNRRLVVVARSAEYIRRGSRKRLPTKAVEMPLMPKMLKHLQDVDKRRHRKGDEEGHDRTSWKVGGGADAQRP